jgi:arylsulfatase A-like enzyme
MTGVALVVLDTLRKDAFDEHFDWLPGERFENAWSPSHWTTPVHASLFTGLYPTEHGVHARNQRFDLPRKTLVERLSGAGYTTRAFSANPNVSPSFDFDRGFELFGGNTGVRGLSDDIYDWSGFTSEYADAGPMRYLRALADCVRGDWDTVPSLKHGLQLKMKDAGLWSPTDSGAHAALEWLDRQSFGDEEFVFLNLMEAHDPYDRIPSSFRTDPGYDPPENIGLEQVFETPNEDAVWQAYDDAVRYLSFVYRDIFDRLKAEMDYVITLSDHGELLGDHGLWGHTYSLYPTLTQVPLVISHGDADATREEVTSLLDVHRTVLDVTGLEGSSRGRSLFQPLDDTPALTEGHGLTSYRRSSLDESGHDVAAYDTRLRGVAVPSGDYGHQTAEGWVTEVGTESVLRDRLEEVVDDLDPRDFTGDAEISDQAMRQLRDLGYA